MSLNVFTVLAHPEPGSFNGAMYETAKRTLRGAGHQVAESDLYRMGFDPVSDRRNFNTVKDPAFLKLQAEETWASEHNGFAADLESEWQKLSACDLLILQFPLWWFGAPAILKGWWDRVLSMGRGYGYGRIYESGVFRSKRALLSITTGGPEQSYLADGFNGDIDGILRPIQRGWLAFVGFSVLAPEIHYGVAHVDNAARGSWLDAWASRLRGIEAEAPIAVGRY